MIGFAIIQKNKCKKYPKCQNWQIAKWLTAKIADMSNMPNAQNENI